MVKKIKLFDPVIDTEESNGIIESLESPESMSTGEWPFSGD